MKNYLRVLVPFVVLGLLAILFFKIKDRLKEKRKVETATAILPSVSFLSIEGDSVSINAPTNKIPSFF
jgi:hypothetical protein